MSIFRVSKLNLLLSSVNVLLLLIFTLSWLLPAGDRVKQSMELQAALDMRPFVTKRPFSIQVDRSFPKCESFCLTMENRPLILYAKDVGGLRYEVQIYLGVDHGIKYLVDMDKGGEILEIFLSQQGTYLTDLNGDGTWDVRLGTSPRRMDIWSNCRWEEVPLGSSLGKYRKQMPAGEIATFNMTSGNWEIEKGKSALEIGDKDKGSE